MKHARTHTQTRTRCFADCCDVFCFVARSKLKCTSPLGYCFLLVYTTRKKKKCRTLTHTLTHAHVALRVCVASLSACCGRLQRRLQSVVAAMTRAHTHARVRQTAGTVSFHTSACTPCTAHYDQCVPANDVCVLGNSQDPPRLLSGSSFC